MSGTTGTERTTGRAGSRAVRPVPEGYHTVTPYLIVNGAAKLIEFAKKAFDAKETLMMPGEAGKVMHAEFRIGNSMIMLADQMAEHPAQPAILYLYVEDVDETFKRALQAGGKLHKEVVDQFYGDRSGAVKDPFGNVWWIATHVEDVPPDELKRRHDDFVHKMKQQKH